MNEEDIIEYEADGTALEKCNEVSMVKKEPSALQKKISVDFEYARKNIKTIIDTGMEAAENLASLASQSEHPRIYECLSNLLQINSVNNTMLLDLDTKMKDLIEGKTESEGGDTITNNNTLLVATTTDIQRMIEDKIKSMK